MMVLPVVYLWPQQQIKYDRWIEGNSGIINVFSSSSIQKGTIINYRVNDVSGNLYNGSETRFI